jgi:hypothetical protein
LRRIAARRDSSRVPKIIRVFDFNAARAGAAAPFLNRRLVEQQGQIRSLDILRQDAQ